MTRKSGKRNGQMELPVMMALPMASKRSANKSVPMSRRDTSSGSEVVGASVGDKLVYDAIAEKYLKSIAR